MSGGSFDYTYDRLGIYVGQMEDKELNEFIPDLQKVLHDLEWWQSGDYSEDQYRKTVNKFKKKWMSGKTPEGEMICPYRKKTETVENTTHEYYMKCYCEECPFYVPDRYFSGGLHTTPYCNRTVKGGAE